MKIIIDKIKSLFSFNQDWKIEYNNSYLTSNEWLVWNYLNKNKYNFYYNPFVKKNDVPPFIWISSFTSLENHFIIFYARNKNLSLRQVAEKELNKLEESFKEKNWDKIKIIKLIEERDILTKRNLSKDEQIKYKKFEWFPDLKFLEENLEKQFLSLWIKSCQE